MFETHEIEYLEEFLTVMQPIAEGIDFLQSEKHMLFGFFIPALVSIKVKMERNEQSQLKYLKDVNLQLKAALIQRFSAFFYVEPAAMDAIIASMVIPQIKLRFAPVLLQTAVDTTEESLREAFVNYGREFADVDENVSESSAPVASFLDFGDEPIGNRN